MYAHPSELDQFIAYAETGFDPLSYTQAEYRESRAARIAAGQIHLEFHPWNRCDINLDWLLEEMDQYLTVLSVETGIPRQMIALDSVQRVLAGRVLETAANDDIY